MLFQYEPLEKSEIRDAKSLAELESRYAKELERAKLDATKEPPPVRADGEIPKKPRDPEEAARYDLKVMELSQAIHEWERLENEVAELKFFCVLADSRERSFSPVVDVRSCAGGGRARWP